MGESDVIAPTVEVVGCPIVCRRRSAQGTRHGATRPAGAQRFSARRSGSAIEELAARYGDPEEDGVQFRSGSMPSRRLDRARA